MEADRMAKGGAACSGLTCLLFLVTRAATGRCVACRDAIVASCWLTHITTAACLTAQVIVGLFELLGLFGVIGSGEAVGR